ncbi:MAG: lytic transglycosylase domain-containing protein [Candidatus Portnoybacteria bacterium]|nr:lytic transglycosylase domain-containing protein [Candidatus Portnoybacteria bacterium]
MRFTKFFIFSLLLLILLAPLAYTHAANDFKFFGKPLVPVCGDKNVCTICDIFRLLQNLINFGLSTVVLVAIVILAYGGILMLFSGASLALHDKGKRYITNSAIGILIVFTSWLAIDTVIKLLAQGNNTLGIGPWNKITCNAPAFPTKTGINPDLRQPAGYTDGYPNDILDQQLAQPPEGSSLTQSTPNGTCVNFSSEYETYINEASAKYGVSPARIKAIITVESHGDPNAVSDHGAIGIMQVLPSTAQLFDRSATPEKLMDPKYAIDMGTRYENYLFDLYGRDSNGKDLAAAAYNGGPAANKPSVNCPGLKRWQCEWDVSGCYPNPTEPQCTENNKNDRPGHRGYGPTRAYVPLVNTLDNKYNYGTCT